MSGDLFFLFNDDNDSDKAAGFVIMSSVRQAKQGRSSCRLVREQVMMATDNDDEISEHGLLGFSRTMFIDKNIEEPPIGKNNKYIWWQANFNR